MAWLANCISLVITYLFKDMLTSAASWVIKKYNEYKQSQASKITIEENLKKIENAATDEERRKNVENLINNT